MTCSQGSCIHLFAISAIIDVEAPSYIRCLSLYAVLGKDKRDFVSASERVNGARATNIEQLGTA